MEQKKIEIIGQIESLKNKELTNEMDDLLKGEVAELKIRSAGWGKNMIIAISDDFNDFIPPGFPN